MDNVNANSNSYKKDGEPVLISCLRLIENPTSSASFDSSTTSSQTSLLGRVFAELPLQHQIVRLIEQSGPYGISQPVLACLLFFTLSFA
jgi:hypothetical protein